MGKFVIGIILGFLFGGALVLYFFGVPSASQRPGAPVKPPDAAGPPPETAQIVLRQDVFNKLLETIFHEMNPPTFPLGRFDGDSSNVAQPGPSQIPEQCSSQITLLPEGSGVQTSVHFENNKIAAPLAFSGSYNSPFGCTQFTGWAQTNLELRFDANQQTVFGRVNVETVNLDGVSPLVSGFVTPLVQSTLNNRVNPIQILQGKQIAVSLPIAATQGNLQANVQDVRADVKDNALNLYIIYDFHGGAPQ